MQPDANAVYLHKHNKLLAVQNCGRLEHIEEKDYAELFGRF